MLLRRLLASCVCLGTLVKGTILMNGQVKVTDYPNTRINPSDYKFKSYDATAPELSYKGRWDSKKVSWWSAPGLVFGFTGEKVAITFGNQTTSSTLIAYRIDGMDWAFTNVTAGATHLLVTPQSVAVTYTYPFTPSRFELRVTNWAYGVQIDKVHVPANETLIKVPNYPRRIEFIGDSLSSGMHTAFEGLSGFAYGVGEGFGNTEYSVLGYPGICVADVRCFDNLRGQSYQWFYTTDTGPRANTIWGSNPEPWNFTEHQAPDLVVINLGTNDNNPENDVPTPAFVEGYTKLIQGVHGKYPNAQIIVMSLWLGFYQYGNTFYQNKAYESELNSMVNYFNSDQYLQAPIIWDAPTNTTTTLDKPSKPFVHLFNTTGILQHNDISPRDHPTDVGAIKVASHLTQYIRLTFGWEMQATGPEVFHDTLYWNDQHDY